MAIEPLTEIVIPQYITRVQTATKRRKKFYFRGDILPKTYTAQNGYTYDKKGFLIDKRGEKVLSNPHSAGTPRWEKLAGNKFSYAGWNPELRAILVQAIKQFYFPFVRENMIPFREDEFPLRVEWDVYTIAGNYDLSNFWFYYKYFEDTLTMSRDFVRNKEFPDGRPITPIIPDDNVRYVTHPPGPRFIPIRDFEDRKFIFRFYKDDRQVLIDSGLWTSLSGEPPQIDIVYLNEEFGSRIKKV